MQKNLVTYELRDYTQTESAESERTATKLD